MRSQIQYQLMSNKEQSSGRIIIKYKRVLYSLLSYTLDHFDGSLYVFLTRKGAEKGAEIHYHTTGRINYRKKTPHTIFAEPLSEITKPVNIMIASLPSLEKLDLHLKSTKDNDYIFNIPSNINGRSNFSLVIAPWNYVINGEHGACIRFENIFSLHLLMSAEKIQTSENLTNHFIYATPNDGIFLNQFYEKDIALLKFHQKLHATNNIIIYSPNTAGVYTIIFSNQMRIPPRATIEFEDKNLHADFTELSHRTTCLKFKVVDSHGNFIKEEKKIIKIELDAEL
jgi:hypothetical protein